MTEEDKQLLLKDLCARAFYGVQAHYVGGSERYTYEADGVVLSVDIYLRNPVYVNFINTEVELVKPYLRPMSSMTEEEKKMVCSMNGLSDTELNDRIEYPNMYVQNYTIETFDLFNAHHLDYRGLIEKGLALEAPEGMYNV